MCECLFEILITLRGRVHAKLAAWKLNPSAQLLEGRGKLMRFHHQSMKQTQFCRQTPISNDKFEPR